jgi:hypothetical protein
MKSIIILILISLVVSDDEYQYILPLNFTPSSNSFCTNLEDDSFYLYVECSSSYSIPSGTFIKKAWNFTYINQNPQEKGKDMNMTCDLIGEEKSHHMICRLAQKFSELNATGPFKRQLFPPEQSNFKTFERDGKIYKIKVGNNDYGYIPQYIGHSTDKYHLSVPIKAGKNSYDYTVDKPPYYFSFEFKENLYKYYAPTIVANISTEIPCTIESKHKVKCYFTKQMLPSSKDYIDYGKINLKTKCGFSIETPFYSSLTDGNRPRTVIIDNDYLNKFFENKQDNKFLNLTKKIN